MKTNSNDLSLSCFTTCKVMTVCLFYKNCTINIVWWKIKSVSASKSVKTGPITFKDSFCFLPFSLASFPKAFELVDLKKGFFPHLFNTPENQSYVGLIPPSDKLVSRPGATKSTAFLMSSYWKRAAKNFEKNFLKRRNLILWSNVSRLQVPVICIGKDIIWVLIILLWNQRVDGTVLIIINFRKLWNGWNGWIYTSRRRMQQWFTHQKGRSRDACRELRGTHDYDTHACVLRGWFRPCDPDRVRISWLCMAWLSLLPPKPQISS